jgi:hypothetical protein
MAQRSRADKVEDGRKAAARKSPNTAQTIGPRRRDRRDRAPSFPTDRPKVRVIRRRAGRRKRARAYRRLASARRLVGRAVPDAVHRPVKIVRQQHRAVFQPLHIDGTAKIFIVDQETRDGRLDRPDRARDRARALRVTFRRPCCGQPRRRFSRASRIRPLSGGRAAVFRCVGKQGVFLIRLDGISAGATVRASSRT